MPIAIAIGHRRRGATAAVSGRSTAASSISRRTSAMSCSRCRGSFWRHRFRTARIPIRNICGQQRPVGLALHHFRQRVRDVFALERALPGQHLVQDEPRRPRCRHACRRPCLAPARATCTRPCPRITPACVIAERRERRRVASARRLAVDWLDRLRQAEVEHLHRAVGADLDVRRLEIAMDDALLVRRFERLGDLLRDRQRLGDGNRAARDDRATGPRPRPVP